MAPQSGPLRPESYCVARHLVPCDTTTKAISGGDACAPQRWWRLVFVAGRQRWGVLVRQPKQEDGNTDAHAAVGSLDAAGRRRMQREQPRKQRQAEGGRHRRLGGLALLGPEARQVAANDFRQCRRCDQSKCLDELHGSTVSCRPRRKRPALHLDRKPLAKASCLSADHWQSTARHSHREPERGSSLIHHSDRGSQYVSIRYTERLAEAGVEPAVGSKGDG